MFLNMYVNCTDVSTLQNLAYLQQKLIPQLEERLADKCENLQNFQDVDNVLGNKLSYNEKKKQVMSVLVAFRIICYHSDIRILLEMFICIIFTYADINNPILNYQYSSAILTL